MSGALALAALTLAPAAQAQAQSGETAADALDAASAAAAAVGGEAGGPTCGPAEPVDAASEDTMELAAPTTIDEPFGRAWLGAADGDVTLVVFVDYACPACREAQPVIDALIRDDPRLKVVYRLFVNEEEGRDAIRTSLAVAHVGGDWTTFHRALDAAGAPTEATIARALATARIDASTLRPCLDPNGYVPAIEDELSRTNSYFYERKGTAVPSWVIGKGKVRAGIDQATVAAAIAKARKSAR